ncbi:alanine racemase [Elongatibacter sediminis]|uniref:Alanine racemase n=1 Tax=Elongatibacter sediminis TaxID=3119006 RepID=A0AAW9RDT7_9GAMM
MSRNTVARIDLRAIRHNLACVRQLAPDSRVACVVKADGYGHGLSRICSALKKADLLAVATTGEGFVCREHGWQGRLLLLEGPNNRSELEDIIELRADMVVHHRTQLDLLRQQSATPPGALWLKIDTGMHRLGFPVDDVAAVHGELEQLRGPQPTVLMSHFACADNRENPMTAGQIERFDAAIRGLDGPVSLANSAGILNFPDSHRDWVRPGIMLYGISPCGRERSTEIGLRPAMSLQCDLIAINSVRQGETVGYGAEFVCPQDMRIGVAAIGYGDGYPRGARSGTPVLVNGRRARLAGRVSMDMITIDLSGLEDARVGDRVTLWGEGLPIEEVAVWAQAIPYELICGVTARVRSVAD